MEEEEGEPLFKEDETVSKLGATKLTKTLTGSDF